MGESNGELKPGSRFGKYRIVGLLGEGGMGQVFRAFDEVLERDVALKLPKFGGKSDQRVVDRFLREAKAAAKIDHPNICPIYDFGQIDDRLFMALKFVDGKPLSKYIRRDNPIPASQCLAVVRRIALALSHAHSLGVIHRDIKPSNIVINRQKEPVIMDFGLAKRTSEDDTKLTAAGTLVGTPAYMSPEQIKSVDADERSDVYSLGAVLFELLTGRLPFEADNAIAMVGKVLSEEIPFPSSILSSVSPEVDEICLKALSRDPNQRFSSMEDFSQAIKSLLVGNQDSSSTSESHAAPPVLPNDTPAPKAKGSTAQFDFLVTQDSSETSYTKPKASDQLKLLISVGLGAFVILVGFLIWLSTPAQSSNVASDKSAAEEVSSEMEPTQNLNRSRTLDSKPGTRKLVFSDDDDQPEDRSDTREIPPVDQANGRSSTDFKTNTRPQNSTATTQGFEATTGTSKQGSAPDPLANFQFRSLPDTTLNEGEKLRLIIHDAVPENCEVKFTESSPERAKISPNGMLSWQTDFDNGRPAPYKLELELYKDGKPTSKRFSIQVVVRDVPETTFVLLFRSDSPRTIHSVETTKVSFDAEIQNVARSKRRLDRILAFHNRGKQEAFFLTSPSQSAWEYLFITQPKFQQAFTEKEATKRYYLARPGNWIEIDNFLYRFQLFEVRGPNTPTFVSHRSVSSFAAYLKEIQKYNSSGRRVFGVSTFSSKTSPFLVASVFTLLPQFSVNNPPNISIDDLPKVTRDNGKNGIAPWSIASLPGGNEILLSNELNNSVKFAIETDVPLSKLEEIIAKKRRQKLYLWDIAIHHHGHPK